MAEVDLVLGSAYYAALFSCLAFLLGFVLGHWLVLDRERRSEWNEGVTEMRNRLLIARDQPWRVYFHNAADIDVISHQLRGGKGRQLRDAIVAYERTRDDAQRQDALGGTVYDNEAGLSQSADELLSLLRRRR